MIEFVTRKISREYNDILLDGAEVWQDGDFKVKASNAEKANDYLVRAVFEIEQKDVDKMSDTEFNKKLEEANKLKNTPSWSGTKKD